jgi:hypothetical protein
MEMDIGTSPKNSPNGEAACCVHPQAALGLEAKACEMKPAKFKIAGMHCDGCARIIQVSVFTLIRALLRGVPGLLAVWLGTVFFGLQQGFWIVFGMIYLAFGVMYLIEKSGALLVSLRPSLSRLSGLTGSAGLVLIALGLWSIGFGLWVSPAKAV